MIKIIFNEVNTSGGPLIKMHPSDVVKEQYKWKSLLRDKILFDGLKPEAPIRKATVNLIRHSRRKTMDKYLDISFKPIKEALIEYGMVSVDANFIYESYSSKANCEKIVIEIYENEICNYCNGGPNKHAWNPESQDYECVK